MRRLIAALLLIVTAAFLGGCHKYFHVGYGYGHRGHHGHVDHGYGHGHGGHHGHHGHHGHRGHGGRHCH